MTRHVGFPLEILLRTGVPAFWYLYEGIWPALNLPSLHEFSCVSAFSFFELLHMQCWALW
jgi:hypothetical protein